MVFKTMNLPLPNFFIVGAAKGGTTSLQNYLSQHPQVYMSPIKETNFFSQADMRADLFNREYRMDTTLDIEHYLTGTMERSVHIANVERWEDYVRLFRNVKDEKARGEASTSYLYCPSTAERLSNTIPDARIVMILRNPIDRAYSHYLMNLRLAKTLETEFIREVETDFHRAERGWGISRLYLELGLYSEQVERYCAHFPAERVHIIIYDDYRSQPLETIAALCKFLGIDERDDLDLSQEYNSAGVPRFRRLNYILTQAGVINAIKRIVPDSVKNGIKTLLYSSSNIPRMSSSDRAHLADFYREDIKQLSTLLGRDLSFWLQKGS